jgi:predicted MFS family arabinose efflux permease
MGFGFGIIMPVFQSMANNLVKPERRGAANSTLLPVSIWVLE